MDDALRALNRFGLGARPGERGRLRDPRAWLHAQLDVPAPQEHPPLAQLSDGLVAFNTEMGQAWADTTVVVMTEFGRTARPNGTRGTDHGTGGVGFVLGPRLARSAMLADWPGLSDRALFEGRDVRPTLDTRAVLKGALAGTFDLTSAQLARVFPGSDGLPGVALMR